MAITTEQNDSITWALAAYSSPGTAWDGIHGAAGYNLSRGQAYAELEYYYRGAHRLKFATEKFENTFGALFQALSENLCPMVIDTIADKLQVEGFTAADETGAATVSSKTREIWRRNRMDERAGQVHQSTLLYGESYVIVWPEPDDKRAPIIYPNRPGGVVVAFDAEKLGAITKAAKVFREGKKIRLNLYFPDRIEKYITPNEHDHLPTEAIHFDPFETPGERWPLDNPYGKVPVFRFANNAAPGQAGQSELRDVAYLQDALNKAICDMMVAMEFEAFAQRWATGLEVPRDAGGNPIAPFKVGIDRVWAVTSELAKFGEFSRADLAGFIEVQNSLRAAISRVSGVPLHYLGLDKGGWPSGEAMKTATERLTAKVRDRQTSYGNTWSDVMRFCMEVAGAGEVDLDTVWKDTSPRDSEQVMWQTALLKQQAGLSMEQSLRELGYTDDQMDAMKEEMADALNGDGFRAPEAANGEEN